MAESVLEQIKEKVDKANSILIVTHENPDGDAVGSSLGFMHGLKKLEGKRVDVLIPELNDMYRFLPGADEILSTANAEEYDLCISLDCSDLDRLASCKEIFTKIGNSIVIDHHITNQNFGDVNYVNAVASSTCQNIIVIMATLDISINKDMATCIYAGMLTDTGGFRYNVQPETFEIAGMLLETGIDIDRIYKVLFDETTEARTKLLGRALNTLETFENGKIAFSYITNKDFEELGCQDGDQENIVNYGRNIKGVEVSIFVREKDGGYKVSLRANEYIDVSRIATKYGGGGHVRAAGFTTEMSFEQLKEKIVEDVKEQLK